MNKKKTLFVLVFPAILLIISILSNPQCRFTVSAAETPDEEGQTFEDFNIYEEDPQAYREYERNKMSLSSGYGDTLSSAYKHNSRFDIYDTVRGIDVSVYQSDINWDKVKKSGIDFAFIRVAYRGYGSGAIVNDANYRTNIENAIAAGVDVGVYIYSQAISKAEAIEEAQHVAALVRDYDIHLPVVMDFEYASTSSGLDGRLYKAKLSRTKATDICNAFCETAEALGYTAAVYANRSMLENQVYADDIAFSYHIWLANYVNETKYKGEYYYWQYSSTGSIKGIHGNVDCNFRYIKEPDAPDSLSVDSSSYTENTLSWSRVNGVYGYQIFRSAGGGSYELAATVKGAGTLSYTDKNLIPNTVYRYKVRSFYKLYDGDLLSSDSDEIIAATPPIPANSIIAANISENSLSLYWSSFGGYGYRLYRSTDGISYTPVADLDINTTTYNETNLSPGTLYYYKLAGSSFDETGTLVYDLPEQSIGLYVSTLCPPPQGLYASDCKQTSITLKWVKCPLATTYYIEQYDALSNSFYQVGEVPAAAEEFTIEGLEPNNVYSFQIRCSQSNAAGITRGEPGSAISCFTQAPAPKAFKASGAATKITLSWKKVDNVTGYEIYRYNKETSAYEKVKTIKESETTSFTNKGLDKATAYSYKIRAYRQEEENKYYGAFSKILYASTAPAKVTNLKYSAKKTSIKLTWKKTPGATGYIVYRYNYKTKKYVKVKTVKATSYTLKKLKKNTTYTYKVVAYKSYKGIKYEGTGAKVKATTKRR